MACASNPSPSAAGMSSEQGLEAPGPTPERRLDGGEVSAVDDLA